jgi:hypothetical protein
MTSELHKSFNASSDDRIISIPLSMVIVSPNSRPCDFSTAFNRKNEIDLSSGETLLSEYPGNGTYSQGNNRISPQIP